MTSLVANIVEQVHQLLHWLEHTDAHPLIASAALHYDCEFIHPFSDGNGRMGRLWQTLILSRWQPLLAYLPVETVIKDRQRDYYHLLRSRFERRLHRRYRILITVNRGQFA